MSVISASGVIDQVEALRDGELDVGFTLSRLDYDHLTVRDLAVEPVVAVLPADHPLAGLDQVPSSRMSGDTFIVWRAPFDELEDLRRRPSGVLTASELRASLPDQQVPARIA